MEEVLAVAGAILLLNGVGGGVAELATRLVTRKEYVPLRDRAASTVLGGVLIGVAVLLHAHLSRTILWVTLALGACAVLVYAAYLLYEDRKSSRTPPERPPSPSG